mmetsp:Transcript_20326/g.51484  ORF Transcript_20326/g.51484 Transcript_20326/m.51484 type:complete len:295 (-) Transcript_20326:277-1161(-)
MAAHRLLQVRARVVHQALHARAPAEEQERGGGAHAQALPDQGLGVRREVAVHAVEHDRGRGVAAARHGRVARRRRQLAQRVVVGERLVGALHRRVLRAPREGRKQHDQLVAGRVLQDRVQLRLAADNRGGRSAAHAPHRRAPALAEPSSPVRRVPHPDVRQHLPQRKQVVAEHAQELAEVQVHHAPLTLAVAVRVQRGRHLLLRHGRPHAAQQAAQRLGPHPPRALHVRRPERRLVRGERPLQQQPVRHQLAKLAQVQAAAAVAVVLRHHRLHLLRRVPVLCKLHWRVALHIAE